MPTNQDLKTFSRLAEALAPWLEHIVVVGGWAHRLYQYHPLAQPLDYPLLTTLDADIAVPNPLPNDLETNMRERLVNAGFEEEFLGEENPPATHFRLGTDPTGFYAEFLTPLIGSDYKHGKRDATTVIAGVAVQKLRYVDLLLVSPWPIKLDPQRACPWRKRFQYGLQILRRTWPRKSLLSRRDRKTSKEKRFSTSMTQLIFSPAFCLKFVPNGEKQSSRHAREGGSRC